MSKELIDALEKAVAELKKNAVSGKIEPSDQHLLNDGWIRHTGDVCPVHKEDDGKALLFDGRMCRLYQVGTWAQSHTNRVTHYKVTKKYDPHAENKALYAEDAKVHKEPWKLWEYESHCSGTWKMLSLEPSWLPNYKYRRKQTKKLVDWSCPLLKGANTNYGEIFDIRELIRYGKVICSQGSPATNLLRLVPPADDKSNWQAYNGEDLNLLHDAGFVVEVKCSHRDAATFFTTSYVANADQQAGIASYRVIGIRDGFTYAKEAV